MRKMTKEEVSTLIKAIIFLAIVALLALMFNIFIRDDGSKFSSRYLIFGNYLVWQKTNTSYKQIEKLDNKILDSSYTIMDGKSTFEDVTMQFLNNEWYFFDKDYNEIDMPSFRVATNGVKVKLGNYKSEDATGDDVVYEFLEDQKVTHLDSYKANKISYDFDKDGEKEDIYTVSNVSLEVTNYDIKGFIFMDKDGKFIKLDEMNNKSIRVMEIIDIDNNGDYEMVVARGAIDLTTFDSCYQLYDYKKGQWKIIKDCR